MSLEPQTQRCAFVPILCRLGVRVFELREVVHDGRTLRVEAMLPDFGGPKGMVIAFDGFGDYFEQSAIATGAGFYLSVLNGEAPTSEQHVKETLDDWGYFGPRALRPSWYTGKPWTGSGQ